VSRRPRRSTGTGEWAAVDGHASGSGRERTALDGNTSVGRAEDWSSVAYNHSLRHHSRASPGMPELIHRRRAAVAHARRRRLWLIDLALGLVLALVAIVLAPGLAVVAVLAAAGLLVSTASFIIGRVRRRRPGNR